LLVQSAHHILGRLERTVICGSEALEASRSVWKKRKKRAIIATTRKLAVLLHHLQVSGEVYELLQK
jgi:hypothetical protein